MSEEIRKRGLRRGLTQVQLNTDVDRDLMEQLTKFAIREGVSKRLAVETAIRRLLVSEAALRAEKKMKGAK